MRRTGQTYWLRKSGVACVEEERRAVAFAVSRSEGIVDGDLKAEDVPSGNCLFMQG